MGSLTHSLKSVKRHKHANSAKVKSSVRETLDILPLRCYKLATVLIKGGVKKGVRLFCKSLCLLAVAQ